MTQNQLHELLDTDQARSLVEGAEERGFIEPAELEAFALELDLNEEEVEELTRELERIGLEVGPPQAAAAGAKEAEKKGEAYATSAGSKLDNAVRDGINIVDVHRLTMFDQVGGAKSKLADASSKADQYRKEAAKEINKEVDKFDKTVEKKTSEAKSGISSWFGGK